MLNHMRKFVSAVITTAATMAATAARTTATATTMYIVTDAVVKDIMQISVTHAQTVMVKV